MLPILAHTLFVLRFDSSKTFWKALIVVIPLLSFKGINHEYLLWMSIANNKNLNPLSNLLLKCISARSAPQILSIKVDCTYLFLKFLIIGLCNFSVKSLLEIFSFSLFHLKFFYEIVYKTLKQVHVDVHHIAYC